MILSQSHLCSRLPRVIRTWGHGVAAATAMRAMLVLSCCQRIETLVHFYLLLGFDVNMNQCLSDESAWFVGYKLSCCLTVLRRLVTCPQASLPASDVGKANARAGLFFLLSHRCSTRGKLGKLCFACTLCTVAHKISAHRTNNQPDAAPALFWHKWHVFDS